MTPRRRSPDPQELGRRGEEAALRWLEARGYAILARNLRTRAVEFDIVARHHEVLVGVEVKTRTGHLAPERCVDAARIARLAAELRALRRVLAPRLQALRIDVIAVRVAVSRDGAADVPFRDPEIAHFAGTVQVCGT